MTKALTVSGQVFSLVLAAVLHRLEMWMHGHSRHDPAHLPKGAQR